MAEVTEATDAVVDCKNRNNNVMTEKDVVEEGGASPSPTTSSSSTTPSSSEIGDGTARSTLQFTQRNISTMSMMNACSKHSNETNLDALSSHSNRIIEDCHSIIDDDDQRSMGSSTSQNTTNTTKTGTAVKHRAGLSEEETKAVRRLRLLLILTLLGVTTIMCVLVWYYLSQNEYTEFTVAFQTQGTKLVEGFRDDSFQKMQALDSLSSSITNYVLKSNANSTMVAWPFVTIANSHEFFEPFLSLANAASIKVVPLVKARQRLQWEQYVVQNQNWIDEDLATQRRLRSLESTSMSMLEDEEPQQNNNVVSRYIKNYVGVDTSPTRWMPTWQYAPVINNRWFINFNQLADEAYYRDVTKSVLEKGQSVISATKTFETGLDVQSLQDFIFTQELLAAGGFGQYQEGEPIGYIHYPVFEDLGNNHNSSQSSPVVAVITASVYWKTFFQNILPDDAIGITCVVENNEQVFTYKINGREATYQGMKDLHDPQFDELVVEAEYKSFEDGKDSARYVGVPVDDQTLTGGYRIRVYPSVEFQRTYTTNDPWIYAVVVLVMMLFAIFVFVVYDCYVERRQSKVSSVAENQDAIITSLFPVKVRDKLYNRQQQQVADAQAAAKKRKNPLKPVGDGSVPNAFESRESKDLVDEFGDNPLKHPMLQDRADVNPHGDSDPIADSFPDCTVLFMDIAGFTKWSSTRQPQQVFVLLETIYHAFDILAKKRKVFKVETIGDCYLAVCGLPEPCETHAQNMSKFARDCLQKMDSLVKSLETVLGEDTSQLQMRIGMHSGPVTAGVLRGDRARFQLFGDTVNTAARMEGTGMKGHIQLSETTAKLLRDEYNMGHLISPRKDIVHAKGKGEVQTYWLAPKFTSAYGTSKVASSRRSGYAASSYAGETSTDDSHCGGSGIDENENFQRS